MRDKDLIPILQWLVRCMYLLLRHIAQTRPGVVDPEMLNDGVIFYENIQSSPYGNRDLSIK